ncbi:sensor histidine kinase [Spirochaeta isovalerica]|uniref:histidine kinase n=1 Tax=Spirochaeta isovalerica TaxID=150 RepID=A0A841R9J2_9SPIO|nr:sensor histidine kinase [Spirochaeta isovalerica]MBB6480575.1 signal transduction histidine kinase [Spirochaeta isovalerica]
MKTIKLEPGWLKIYGAIHGLKVLYYMITLLSFFTESFTLWTKSFPFHVALILLLINIFLLALPMLRPFFRGNRLRFYLAFLLAWDFFLILAEYYYHLAYLYSDRYFLSAIGIMPPYLSALVLLMLVAWQYRRRMFILIVVLRMVLSIYIISLLNELEGLKWIIWTLFETASLFIMGGIVFFLVSQLKKQREDLKSMNRQITRHAATAEELAVSWERNRLARELHDTLAHSFSALAVQLEACRRFLEQDRDKAKKFLEEAHKITVGGLNDTRAALKELRSAPLEEMGLVLALREAAVKAADRCGAELELDLPEAALCTIPEREEQMIYRIALEALENAVRHSGASHLSFKFSFSSGSFCLKISDRGQGFDAGEPHEGKWGLIGMAERAGLIGAVFTVKSRSGQGTEIILEKSGSDYENSHY